MGTLDGNSAAFAAVAGFFVLFHACYAVIAHNDNLKLAGEEFAAVPLGVVLECVAGAALCAWGACGFAGEFLPIKATPREAAPPGMERVGDFMIFNHRGAAIGKAGGK